MHTFSACENEALAVIAPFGYGELTEAAPSRAP